MSLGFYGLVADWYWMRSLQYVGRKIINRPQNVQLDNLGQLNLKLLAPLLDATTTLDPEFMEPYEYAAVVLPDVDLREAIRITRKGIAANPSAWRLYQHLGYIYWEQHEFEAASETYGQGAKLPGAPVWMLGLHARLAAEGGSLATAREIYERMYEGAGDPSVKEMARLRLLQVESFAERSIIRRALADYATRTKHCASSWKDVSASLRAAGLRLDGSGIPLDPAATPYQLVQGGCDVDLDSRSQVPYR
jgi:tetratricopeptide (TPR) repeat protein